MPSNADLAMRARIPSVSEDRGGENTMSQKRLILFGTRHWEMSQIPAGIRESLRVLRDKFQPDVALEEWSATHTQKSALADFCDSISVPWENIGTPSEAKFKTFDHTAAADYPVSINVIQYGPLSVQKNREEAMCENITRAMSSRNVALIVVGVAHLHSMMVSLSKGTIHTPMSLGLATTS